MRENGVQQVDCPALRGDAATLRLGRIVGHSAVDQRERANVEERPAVEGGVAVKEAVGKAARAARIVGRPHAVGAASEFPAKTESTTPSVPPSFWTAPPSRQRNALLPVKKQLRIGRLPRAADQDSQRRLPRTGSCR